MAQRFAGRSRTITPLVAVLLLSLVLVSVVAYQAQDAARSQRKTVEGALRDYAAVTSWEFARKLRDELAPVLTSALIDARLSATVPEMSDPRIDDDADTSLLRFAVAIRSNLARCSCETRDLFHADFATNNVRVLEPKVLVGTDRELLQLLAERSRRGAGTNRREEEVMLRLPDGRVLIRKLVGGSRNFILPTVPGHPGRALVYTVGFGDSGEPLQAYGFSIERSSFLRNAIERVLRSMPLLPPTLVGNVENADLVVLAVQDSAGNTIYRSAHTDRTPAPAVVDTIRGDLGLLQTRISIRPSMAERLIIGGLPRSRLPLLLGLVVLTLVLLAIAVMQVRKQQELHRLRSDFISGISHELRTPLSQIRLFSELLGSGKLPETKRQRYTEIIGEEAQRLSYLVENVLRFARSERTADRLPLERQELRVAVQETLEIFAPLARTRRVRLETRVPDGLIVMLNRDAFRQVLLNLLDNAAKYGPRRQTISVGAVHIDGNVLLAIDDQGPGIPEHERERVWQPYHRLARDQNAETGGSGIGLAIVRELVTLQGGEAWIEAAPGGGVRAVIQLPCANRLPPPSSETGRLRLMAK